MIGLSLTFRAVRLAILVVSIPGRIRRAWRNRVAAEEERRRARMQAVAERLARGVSIVGDCSTIEIDLPADNCAHLTRSSITGACMHCGAPPVRRHAPSCDGPSRGLCNCHLIRWEEVAPIHFIARGDMLAPCGVDYGAPHSARPIDVTCPTCRAEFADILPAPVVEWDPRGVACEICGKPATHRGIDERSMLRAMCDACDPTIAIVEAVVMPDEAIDPRTGEPWPFWGRECYAPPGTARTLCGRELHGAVYHASEVGISYPGDPERETYYVGKPDRASCPACRSAMEDGAPIAPREPCTDGHARGEPHLVDGRIVCSCGVDLGAVDAGGVA